MMGTEFKFRKYFQIFISYGIVYHLFLWFSWLVTGNSNKKMSVSVRIK
ncbi:hypothetical protein J2787_003168 [Chryseobacterium rhizosphaerae]|uniref:Uncharacterized protein n=1 Tax=Chryseobacterium rhizosphaerae TaxID=395937 RepID=A0AAE4C2P9_9FLAO|nr:hypothetical protein [Chryseobacterium rhizosphaerae]